MPAIFVFGSNLAGQHLGGAARFAYDKRGARWGEAEGRQGESYAIPTVDATITPLPVERVAAHVATFVEYAKSNPAKRFEITRIGCGIAGFKPWVIAPMFAAAPANCDLPEGWRDLQGEADVPHE